MSKAVTPRKCSECGKRRIPAKRSNGRLSTKCKECFGGLFWTSAFGRWFADATTRQSPDSMPFDEEDIKGIYKLWLSRKEAIGYTISNGSLQVSHDYHISHRDPANGDGFQGRFTTENLLVAPAQSNKAAYNAELINHGHRVYTDKKPFKTTAKVRQWCNGQYNLNDIVRELELKKYSPPKRNTVDINPDFLPKGKTPETVLEQQLGRFEGGGTDPWRHTIVKPSDAFVTVISYGIGLGKGKLKDNQEEPSVPTVDDF
jgi:hypothetical protein